MNYNNNNNTNNALLTSLKVIFDRTPAAPTATSVLPEAQSQSPYLPTKREPYMKHRLLAKELTNTECPFCFQSKRARNDDLLFSPIKNLAT